MQYMVLALVSSRTFYGHDVQRLFDNAQDRRITGIVAAGQAWIFFGDVETVRTEPGGASY
jgi:hypothetical protein